MWTTENAPVAHMSTALRRPFMSTTHERRMHLTPGHFSVLTKGSTIKVVARYGNPSQHPTKRVAPSATSGTLTRRFYQTTLTKVSAKKAARHLTWNAGTTPCARDWLASCAKLFLSPSPTFTMKLYSSCISITTIQRGPHQLPCNHYREGELQRVDLLLEEALRTYGTAEFTQAPRIRAQALYPLPLVTAWD